MSTGNLALDPTSSRSRLPALPLHHLRVLLTGAASLGLLLLLLASPSSAESGYEDQKASAFGRPGGYISVGVGGAAESFDFDLGGLNPGTALLIGGRIGARANRFVALEATVDYSVKGFEASGTVAGLGSGSLEAKALLATANLKLYPFDSRIQPFVMGGGGVLHATLECKLGGVSVSCGVPAETSFAGRVGGGLDVYLTRNLAVSGEVAYVIPTGDLADINFLTFGGQLMFRF